MAKSYRLSPLAEADLEEIWLYTRTHWSMKQADTYHHQLVASFESLASGEKQGAPSLLPGFLRCLCGSHVIYFFADDDYLNIIRILHQRQDVERHLLLR